MKEVGNLGIIIYTQTYESIYTQLRRQQFTFLQLHALFFLQQSIKRLHKIRKNGKEYSIKLTDEKLEIIGSGRLSAECL